MSQQEPYWVDQLERKHECFGYDSTHAISVSTGGQEYSVIVPEYVQPATLLAVSLQGDLLSIIGTLDQLWNERPIGFFILARHENAFQFSAVVCHQLYPYAIEKLGLSNSSS